MEENMLQTEETPTGEVNNHNGNASQTEESPLNDGQMPDIRDLPRIDLTAASTNDLIKYAEDLIQNFPMHQTKEILDKLPLTFDVVWKKEYNEALEKFKADDGALEEDFKYPNHSKEQFYTLLKLYKDKRIAEIRQIEIDREKNLQAKLQLIEELKELIQKEESLNKTFQEFKDIQERWRNTGAVPQSKVNDLLETYYLHVENFYNYIKINKELRDLDLKHNLDEKLQLCCEAEKLTDNNDINGAFRQLQSLHARWKEIGPVHKDQKEPLWERFKNITDQINEKYHSFFENLRKEQENNLSVKVELCERAEAVSQGEYKTIGEWNKAVQQLVDMQEEWKHVGTVLLKERNKIYKRFRSACDEFFDKKRIFYKNIHKEQDQNLALKIELCEKVEALKDSTDWKATADKIIAYQKQWKTIGPAPQRISNKVWSRFRAACDEFFDNKKKLSGQADSGQAKNLELKKELVEEVKHFTLSGNNEEDVAHLQDFQKRWTEIGFVPFKEKNTINEAFRNALNVHFDKMNIGDFDKKMEKFKVKLQNIDNSGNKEFKIVNEREKLVNKIRQLETDINIWENNIGFFSKSKNAEKLINDLNEKIQEAKQRLVLLIEKLKALDNLI